MTCHWIVFFSALCAIGCASSSPSTPTPPTKESLPKYSKPEAARLGLCEAYTDNVVTIATYKLAGHPSAGITQEYTRQPNAEVLVPLVEKVYGDSFANRWDYAVSFFRECALNIANVPAPRSDMASYCMQNAMVAAISWMFKDTGAPKSQAREEFVAMGATPLKIVDETYASRKPRAEFVLGVFNTCMKPLT